MYRYPFPDDPNYLSDPATFIRGAVSALLDYAVVPDPTMGRRLIEISKKEREIRVLPGQSIRRFHQLIDIASLYVVGGVAWAPEFHTGPRLHLVTNERRHSGDGSCCPTCRQAIGGG